MTSRWSPTRRPWTTSSVNPSSTYSCIARACHSYRTYRSHSSSSSTPRNRPAPSSSTLTPQTRHNRSTNGGTEWRFRTHLNRSTNGATERVVRPATVQPLPAVCSRTELTTTAVPTGVLRGQYAPQQSSPFQQYAPAPNSPQPQYQRGY